MSVMERRILPVLAVVLAATVSGPAGADGGAVVVPVVKAQSGTSMPSDATVPPMRAIPADGVVSGSEPDPETFDRAGLEMWWQSHQRAISFRAENTHK